MRISLRQQELCSPKRTASHLKVKLKFKSYNPLSVIVIDIDTTAETSQNLVKKVKGKPKDKKIGDFYKRNTNHVKRQSFDSKISEKPKLNQKPKSKLVRDLSSEINNS